jgi:hypothetical protein
MFDNTWTPADEEIREVEAALRENDVPFRATIKPAGGEYEIGSWLTISVSLGALFGGFLQSAAQKAGEDAYLACKRLFSRIFDRASARTEFNLFDNETGAYFFIERALPDSAYRQLYQLQQASKIAVGGVYSWDQESSTWRQLNRLPE